MCGIFGKFSQEGVGREELSRMAEALAHRGPDDEGLHVKGPIGIGSRRLSIIDLQGGRQPISNEDGSIWIVCNGEIYNYKSLRRALEEEGHVFGTRSDTEVIIHLYESFGESCLERLRGMFAFAIWDDRVQKLFLARDRLGQKPLFYSQDGNTFLFASESKAILATLARQPEIDFESIHHYLSLRFIPSPRTMFQDIRKLPSAHYLIWQDGISKITRYWDLSFRVKIKPRDEEIVEALDEKLKEAVDSHLVSDVPVGAFLSGGLDSSTIVAYMARAVSTPVKTFSVGAKEQDFNELPYARIVAERYGTSHVEQLVDSNLISLVPRMIWHLDEPSDPIAACMFHAANLASRHVKVVLGGDGGDELFAGFDRYRGVGSVDYYSLIPSVVREKIIAPIIGSIPDSFTYQSLSQRLKWMQELASLADSGDRYARATTFFRFSHEDKRRLFCDTLWKQVDGVDSSRVIVEQFDKSNAEDLVDKMLYADFVTRLPEHTLMLTDRMTMAHGLEARSPFLDHSLVEFLATLPSHLKIRNGELKYVLRKLAARYLPERIVGRRKQGFMFPIAYWFRNELYESVKGFLLDSQLVREGLFRRETVCKLMSDHRICRNDNHVRIWMLLNLEVWNQIYVGKQSVESLEERMSSFSHRPLVGNRS